MTSHVLPSSDHEVNCTLSMDAAVRRLVDSFSMIPTRWIQELALARHDDLLCPMWGTLFLPSDHVDVSGIERLLCPLRCAGDDELRDLRDAGWQSVGKTGILATHFDDELLLGIHGAGYDFYEGHWTPLYQALGYEWHR